MGLNLIIILGTNTKRTASTLFRPLTMRAEVIAIGDELTTGQRLDTNTQWLSQRLTELGIEVAFHTTISDQLDDNVAAFRMAIERTDLVVATGGLGPTADDLTREALAAATDTTLVRDATSLAHIEQLFASRARTMPERNRVQADFPTGARPIPNPHGTAPGIDMLIEREGRAPAAFIALPGVPAEMHEMWAATVAKRIEQLRPEPQVTCHRRIKCFGVGESRLEEMLPNLIRRDRHPRVGITVSDATITLRITATAIDEAACLASMEPTIATIRESLGSLVFGDEDDELQHAVTRLLQQTGQTLAVAEWATAGLVSEWMTSAAGEAFLDGATTTNRHNIQSVSSHVTDDASAVAVALAESARQKAGADIGLGIAAFPPHINAADAYVCVAVALPNRTRKSRFHCAAHPSIVRSRTAKQALNALRLTLLGNTGDT